MSFDWKDAVRTVAPAIASVFGTPVAGLGVKALVDAILPDDSPAKTGSQSEQETAIARALDGGLTPELAIKIKELDAAFSKQMSDAGINLEQLANADRDSARKREVATGDWTPKALAFVITTGFFCLIIYIVTRPAPIVERDLMNVLIGSSAAAWTSVVSYYFGSSAGSARSREILGQIASK